MKLFNDSNNSAHIILLFFFFRKIYIRHQSRVLLWYLTTFSFSLHVFSLYIIQVFECSASVWETKNEGEKMFEHSQMAEKFHSKKSQYLWMHVKIYRFYAIVIVVAESLAACLIFLIKIHSLNDRAQRSSLVYTNNNKKNHSNYWPRKMK